VKFHSFQVIIGLSTYWNAEVVYFSDIVILQFLTWKI